MTIRLFGYEICPFGRCLEFLEDSKGRFAVPSLIAIVGVGVLSIVIILDAIHAKTSETVIATYATLVASLYGIKKGFDTSEVKAQIKADSGPDTTSINQPAGPINIAGDVKVKKDKK